MSTEVWLGILGSVAGFCTTFAFVPQVVKIWRQGGRDLSYGMLTVYWVGVGLWFAYGLLLHARAVIVANLASIVLISFAIGLKVWTGKRDKERDEALDAREAARKEEEVGALERS